MKKACGIVKIREHSADKTTEKGEKRKDHRNEFADWKKK
jgi:hypothetical protein